LERGIFPSGIHGIYHKPHHLPALPDLSKFIWQPEPKPPSREEFDRLKQEIEELKLLLLAAKRFDEARFLLERKIAKGTKS
jgi:hypothetical protein